MESSESLCGREKKTRMRRSSESPTLFSSHLSRLVAADHDAASSCVTLRTTENQIRSGIVSRFTSHRGSELAAYKLQLGVYANGYTETDRGKYLSVFVYLLEGEYDSLLTRPEKIETIVLLFDQRKRPEHIRSLCSGRRKFEQGAAPPIFSGRMPPCNYQPPAMSFLLAYRSKGERSERLVKRSTLKDEISILPPTASAPRTPSTWLKTGPGSR